jgi:hypothetical protein
MHHTTGDLAPKAIPNAHVNDTTRLKPAQHQMPAVGPGPYRTTRRVDRTQLPCNVTR